MEDGIKRNEHGVDDGLMDDGLGLESLGDGVRIVPEYVFDDAQPLSTSEYFLPYSTAFFTKRGNPVTTKIQKNVVLNDARELVQRKYKNVVETTLESSYNENTKKSRFKPRAERWGKREPNVGANANGTLRMAWQTIRPNLYLREFDHFIFKRLK
jgi:hypothetical protein